MANPDSHVTIKASIVQLLARPEAFDGKRVRVTGFIHFEFEGNGIYGSQTVRLGSGVAEAEARKI